MEEVVAGGGRMDEIPLVRISVVAVVLGRELIVDEHTVSRDKAVTRQGEISGVYCGGWVGS